jgi:basic amino acid/polyamine antiporter, APA family
VNNPRLLRALGIWGVAAGIVNITIGGGIFRLPGSPEVAGRLGAAAPLAFVVCAIAMALIVLCIAEAGSRVAVTGGLYAYVEVAFGPFAGFIAGVLLWLGATMAFAAVATIFASSVGRVMPSLADPGAQAMLLLAVFALLAFVNILGIRQGSRVNTITAIAKIVPLLVLIVAGIFAVDPANLMWSDTPSAESVIRASIFLIFAFAGIESALLPTGEVRNPARTVPVAILAAMAVVTIIYIMLQIVAQGTLGPALVGSATPLADAAGRAMGPAGVAMISLGVILSTFGYLSGMTLAVPRALFALSRDGFLPAALSRVHSRWQTPWLAIFAQAALVYLLAITSGFELLAIIANGAILLVFLGAALATIQLRRRDVRAGGKPFRLPAGPLIPILASLVVIVLLSSVTLREWAVIAGVVAAATLLYVATRRFRERRRGLEVTAETEVIA